MKLNKTKSFKASRRQFLKSSSSVVGLACIIGPVTACTQPSAVAVTEAIATNLEQNEFQLLARMGDLLIPATDTPGALEAGVPQFIDTLLSDWAGEKTRLEIRAAITGLDEHADSQHNTLFLSLKGSDQLSALASYEEECFSKQDEAPLTPDSIDYAVGYRRLKSLIYRGYYHSEIGCTQELQYQLIPGPEARQDAPLSEVGRTWAVS